MRYLQNIFIFYAFTWYIFGAFCISRICFILRPVLSQKAHAAAGQRAMLQCAQNLYLFFVFALFVFALQPNRNYVIVTSVQSFCCTGDCFIFYRRFFMKLRTRVLSFMLAGSMMLSATPVSAFAETNHTESPISTIVDISNDQSVLTASASNQTYTMPMMVAADNVTFTNCTFEQSVSVAGNNVQFINCTVKSFESIPLSVATLKDYIALLQSQGYSYTVSDFSAIANPEAASLVLNGGTYDNYICGLSGALTITGNGTFTNKIAIVNSDTTIESGTFTGPVAAVAATPLKIKGGLFSRTLAGWSNDSNVYKIQAPDTTFDSTSHPSFKNQYGFFYVATSSNFEPVIKMVYNGADGTHQIATWRLEMTNSNENYHKVGYADEADYAAKLQLAGYQADDVKTTIQFKCIDNYNGYRPIHGDIQLDPVYAMNASDLTFTAPSSEQEAAVTSKLADAPQLTLSYYNIDDNTSSNTYPTKAGTYQVKAVSSETKYFADGSTYYKVTAGDEFTSDSWRFQISTNTVTLTVDENGAPVIPEGAKGVRYANNTLTIDAYTTARFAQGSTVKCDIVNNGTLDGGLFTGTVTGSGSIARGLFLNKPDTTLPTMMLSVPENASLNGITKPDTTGLTTLYAINALDGKDDTLLFTGDYIGTDPHEFYGWDLVYSLGGEEKNSGVDHIGQTRFEQPMGTIPYHMNGVNCTFLPVLKMDASDLTITADKPESKIDGAVIESVQYVDLSDPNAAPSTVYPTKKGSYKAIVALNCTGDSTDPEDRVARIGNLCYYVPETLEVPFTVDSEPVQPELPVVPPTDDTGTVVIPADKTEVQGDGWTAKKDEDNKTTVTITGDKDFKDTTLNCDKITIGSEGTSTTVSNITTNADVTVARGSAIGGGTFSGDVSGDGTIAGGTFSGNVGSEVEIKGGTFTGSVESTNISGGVFAGQIPDTVTSTQVTATGGASINNIQKNEGANQATAVQVVGEQQLSLAYTPAEGRTFYGWQKDQTEIIAKGDTTTTVSADSTDSVYTPVVEMNMSDIQDGESNIEGTKVTSIRYYKVDENGQPVGDGYADAPVDDGTYEDGLYAQYIALELVDDQPENTIALYAALYADENAPSRVVKVKGVGYYVPELLATGEEVRIGDIPNDTATGSGDSGAGGAAVAVIGGAAIGGAAYLIGTQMYLTSVLPEGASVPTNRQQLADLLWTAAGKPQPASTALFTDISAEAADSQKAARWCVEQGLLKDTGSTFKPDKHTFRPQVIKAWNDLQAKLNPQK